MTLTLLYLWLFAGALLAWFSGRFNKNAPRVVAIGFMIVHLVGVVVLWSGFPMLQAQSGQGDWLLSLSLPWIPQLGIRYSLALDGLSLLLIFLTAFLGLLSVAASWKGITEKTGFFYFNLLWILGAIVGVFLAVDLFLFYFFWEMMLIPLYFLIGIWGHENRTYATLKFFIFTQAGGLFMLLAFVALYLIHGANTGFYTFEYTELLGTNIAPEIAFWLMLGLFVAFAVKLPMVPLHTWLPDAHTEAPTAGSVVLAGLVLKAGAYGMIRFMVPLFPQATFDFSLIAMVLGVISILYGAIVAFGQTDLKRLVAYTSVSHMGFVLLGIFAWNEIALQGALIIVLAHGLSTGALFILVGAIQERLHTREMGKMGGIWSIAPKMSGWALFFALASLGLPGMANFVGEFLVLLGLFQINVPIAVVATFGFVVASIYSLWIVQKAFHGGDENKLKLADFDKREVAVMASLGLIILWLGLFPQMVFNTSRAALDNLRGKVEKMLEEPQKETVERRESDKMPRISGLTEEVKRELH